MLCFWCCLVCCLFTSPLYFPVLHPCSPSCYCAMQGIGVRPPPPTLMWFSSLSSEQAPFPTVLLVSFGLLFTCWSFTPSYVAYVLPLTLMCCVGRKVKSDKDHHPPPLVWFLSPSSEQPPFPYRSFGVVWFVVCLLDFHALLCYVHAPLRIVVLCKEEW